jgi:hypothetical protein
MDESVSRYLERDEVSQILARAAQLVSERGLHKGDLFRQSPTFGPLCAEGAIIAAIAGGSVSRSLTYEQQVLFHHAENRARRLTGGRPLSGWNDEHGRTQFEVVALLSRAAAEEVCA